MCNPVNSCGVADAFENYMIYGDHCMTEFSPEQILRRPCRIEHYRPDLGLSEIPGTWVDLGGGTSGSNGSPTLDGGGLLLAGSVATIELQSAPPNAAVLLWISLTSTPLNVQDGTVLGGITLSNGVRATAP